MTTSETIQAESLARWIDGDRDMLPNAECSVALWAMRPDLAPNPRVTLDDILSRVKSGPFVETEQGVEDSYEDDFVEAIFARARDSVQTKVSLNDVLTKVESGPFAQIESNTVRQRPLEARSPTANNNRWWSSPVFAGGLAAVLVLFILIPTKFKSTVSEDSMFVMSVEIEEELPAEDMDANIVSKQEEGFGKSSKLEVQRAPQRNKTSNQRVELEVPSPAKSFNSQIPEVLKESMVIEEVDEPVDPPSPVSNEIEEGEPTNSFSAEPDFVENDVYDLVGKSVGSETDVLNGYNDDVEGFGDLEDEFVEYKELLSAETQAVVEGGGAVPSVEVSADSTRGVMDRKSRTKGTRQTRGALFQKTEGVESVAEESVSVANSEVEAVSTQLPSVLTVEQQRLVRQATNAPSVFALCDNRQPTQALEILWTASRRLPTSDAITVLKQSSSYDHGDIRYLKRNWLRLSSLLFQTGQEEEGVKYQQQASSLP